MYRTLTTRLLANGILALRALFRRHTALPSFVVCTGTSGKTLNRATIATLLKRSGIPYVSPPLGYTNELGILLASVGLRTATLRTWHTWHTLLFSTYTDAWVCIEIGADFRADIPWFLAHFSPTVVVCTAEDTRDWYPRSATTRSERRQLAHKTPMNGAVITTEDIHLLSPTHATRHATQYRLPTRAFWDPSTPYVFGPQQTAVDVANMFAQHFGITQGTPLTHHDVHWPPHRLVDIRLKSGARVLCDTYKALPLCTTAFVTAVAQTPARARILVLGEPHPTLQDLRGYAHDLAPYMCHFTEIILVGRRFFRDEVGALLGATAWYGPHVETETVAQALRTLGQDGDLIVIKGATQHGFATLEQALLVPSSS